jgi:hypothetical protein
MNKHGISIKIEGHDEETTALILAALNHGLAECGFENVMGEELPDLPTNHQNKALVRYMRQVRVNNPEIFTTEVVLSAGSEENDNGREDAGDFWGESLEDPEDEVLADDYNRPDFDEDDKDPDDDALEPKD